MTDKSKTADNNAGAEKKTLSLGGKGTLSLKGAVSSPAPARAPGVAAAPSSLSVEVRRSRRTGSVVNPQGSQTSAGNDEARLTTDEREARARALHQALNASGTARTSLPKRQIIEPRTQETSTSDPAAMKTDARAREMEELNRIESEERRRAEETKKMMASPRPGLPGRAREDDEESESVRDRLKKAAGKESPKREGGDRRGGRITVQMALRGEDESERGRSLAAQRRAREKARLAALGPKEPAKKILREVILPETITVQELANRMAESGGDVVKALMKMGMMATITQTIDADTAELIAQEFGHAVKRVTDADVEVGLEGATDAPESLQPRPPVVTIMGHVDHGKTSLLDALRATDVVSGEAGGITQHIGAYQVTLKDGQKITFLDTPGHAAFTEMRARGANVTDIVVIVVSAEDSVMPQTIEAIKHARAANVPLIIAINKIDLPAANPQKIKQDLLQHEVVVEEMGGDVLSVEISAKKKINLDKLEETILLQSEVLELKANPNREAHGTVVESKLEKGRGPVATVLIQKGTLRVGDIFVAGAEFGKVRALLNDRGETITQAGPGLPVEVLGLNGVPEAGDSLVAVDDETKARSIADYRQRKNRDAKAARAVKGRTTMDDLLLQREAGEKVTLPVIIKGDVHGSVEAIAGSLAKLGEENAEIAIQVLHTGVGGITESDVTLARASRGLIIGFNVRASAQARDLAVRDGVEIRYYNVIYNIIDDAKAILSGMLSPSKREEYLGQAQIRQVFNITKVGKVAGCMVTTGVVKRGAKVRLLRDDVVIHEGTLKTLKRFKDEVREVKEGMECGMAFETYDDIKEGDVIECYQIVEEARTVA
ncbi:MAG: translation initiation factor IF-2 [Alphaproteobacteria bacterium]|nr:translation initiation factor IF-2 [Alphaproteobacteria bacterium]